MNGILIILLIMLWTLTNTLCAAVGFFISRRLDTSVKPNSTADSLPPISENERRRAERSRKEWRNMLTYDGNEQSDINA